MLRLLQPLHSWHQYHIQKQHTVPTQIQAKKTPLLLCHVLTRNTLDCDQSNNSSCIVSPTYLLNLVQLEIAQFNPPTPKTILCNQTWSEFSKMADQLPFEFGQTGNSAIQSADPENPTLESNMEWIGWSIAKISPFEFFQMRGRLLVGQSSIYYLHWRRTLLFVTLGTQGCHSPVMIKFRDFSLTFPDILRKHLLIIDPLNSSDINKCTHFSLPHSYILTYLW